MIQEVVEYLVRRASREELEAMISNPYPDLEFRKTETGFEVAVKYYERVKQEKRTKEAVTQSTGSDAR